MSAAPDRHPSRHTRRLLASVVSLAAATAVLAACGSSGSDASKDPKATLAAAVQLEQQGDLNDAAQLFNKVIAVQPNNYVALYDLGVISQTQHDPGTALNYYGRALKTDPRYVPALFNAATIYQTSNPALAISIYRKVISLQPHAPTAYLNLGKLEIAKHQAKRGVKDLATALTQDSSLLPQIPSHLRALVQSQILHAQRATQSPSGSTTASPSASPTTGA
jgi:tetratricopeptide (TPR) repeat protein